jgi:hypothetical protein
MKWTLFVLPAFAAFSLTSCVKDPADTGPNNATGNIIFKYKFDSTQERLNNLGLPATIPAGNAAQSPRFNHMSSHYIEMAPADLTPLGAGAVAYKATETNAGGGTAIDFSQSVKKGDGEVFYTMPIKNIPVGSYKHLRVSLAYQNYDINYKFLGATQTGTVASFIGYNTYITSFNIKNQPLSVNAAKAQGFWAFESLGQVISGQAPPGATTVPNPLFATSPIPQGSCVVTGRFLDANGNAAPLVIAGNESRDIVITVSLSTNKSFEWIDTNGDGMYEPAAGEIVRDMGLRGLKPFVVR